MDSFAGAMRLLLVVTWTPGIDVEIKILVHGFLNARFSVLTCSLFVWLWLVVNDRKFPVGTVFFSHTNQPTVLLHEPANRSD